MLFVIISDGDMVYVEADTVEDALILWRADNDLSSETDVPDSISLLTAAGVLRHPLTGG